MIEVLSPQQIKDHLQGGKILSNAIKAVVLAVKPGISTIALDEIAETEIRRAGGQPSFKNYHSPDQKPYPFALCVSINDQVVHGVPNKGVVVKTGDLVSVDLGCRYKGLNTDMAVTVGVGRIKPIEQKLLAVTKNALKIGIGKVKDGARVGDIGSAIQEFVEANGFSVVRDLVGHGVGTKVHQDPSIPNFGKASTGSYLTSGNPLAIEPMVNIGNSDILVSTDGWTIKTKDGSKSAHFEQTVIVTTTKPIIVTPF